MSNIFSVIGKCPNSFVFRLFVLWLFVRFFLLCFDIIVDVFVLISFVSRFLEMAYLCTIGDCVLVFSSQEDLVLHAHDDHHSRHCPHEGCNNHYHGRNANQSLAEHRQVTHFGIQFGCLVCRGTWPRRNGFYQHRGNSQPGCLVASAVQISENEVDSFRNATFTPPDGRRLATSMNAPSGMVVAQAGAAVVAAALGAAPAVQPIVDGNNPPFEPPIAADVVGAPPDFPIVVLRQLLFPTAESVGESDSVESESDRNSDISSILVNGSSSASADGTDSGQSSQERSFLDLSPIGKYSFSLVSSFCLIGCLVVVCLNVWSNVWLNVVVWLKVWLNLKLYGSIYD